MAYIRDQLCDQNDDDRDNRDAQKQLDVIVLCSLSQHPAEAFVVEQGFHYNNASQQPRNLLNNDCKWDNQRIAQGVF